MIHKTITTDEGYELKLEYSILKLNEQSYGLRVQMINQQTGEGEVKSVANLFDNEKDAKGYMEFLADNCVTPTTLENVAEDLLCIRHAEFIENNILCM